jgi:hypothetical protein
MVEDDRQNVASRHYSEEDRVALKGHIERVAAQRGVTCDAVDFEALWEALETAATVYDQCVAQPAEEPKATASDTLKMLTGCAATIRTLRSYLTNPALLNWDFVSSDGLRRTTKSEAPRQRLLEELAKLQNEKEADARELQEALGSAKAHAGDASDSRAMLMGLVLDVGRQIFGPNVGRADGPLVTFLRLSLEPVLGEDTPSAETLRTFARRGGGGWSAPIKK